jgi:hypothetical protein
MSEQFGDREGDNVVVLMAIAEAAGSDWRNRAEAALLAVYTRAACAAVNASADGTMLLEDIRTIFQAQPATSEKAKQLPTGTILTQLIAMDHRPWAEHVKGRPITAGDPSRLTA